MTSTIHARRSTDSTASLHTHLSAEVVQAHVERTRQGAIDVQQDFDSLALSTRVGKVATNLNFLRIDSSSHSLSSQASDWMFDESEINTDGCLEVGQGSVSKVYMTTVRGSTHAVKILRHDFEDGDLHKQASQDFQNEFTVGLQGLSHPNIVRFLGGCNLEKDGAVTPALVYEYMDGGCLEEVFEFKKMKLGKTWKPPLLLSLSWCTQLSKAVSYLHNFETKFAHRDIKPANILVSRDLRVLKLADFSLATFIRDDSKSVNSAQSSEESSEASSQKAIPLSIAGSFRYMAPEVMSDQPYQLDRADVYSTALTCWTLIHGEPPFAQIADAEMAHLLAGQSHRPAVHPKLADVAMVLDHAWAADASKRPSAQELADSFEGILEHRASKMGCFSLFRWKNYLPVQRKLNAPMQRERFVTI
eukprot:2220028-Rhodomonas_salina.2